MTPVIVHDILRTPVSLSIQLSAPDCIRKIATEVRDALDRHHRDRFSPHFCTLDTKPFDIVSHGNCRLRIKDVDHISLAYNNHAICTTPPLPHHHLVALENMARSMVRPEDAACEWRMALYRVRRSLILEAPHQMELVKSWSLPSFGSYSSP